MAACSTQQSKHQEFTPAVNDWWMGLGYFDICRYWETYTNMFVAETQLLKWTNDRVLCAWNNTLMLGGKFPNARGKLGGNLGDAGWKLYGEVRKRPKYLNWELANIIDYNNSASRNRVVSFIHWDTFQHTRFSCEFLQMLQLIPNIQLISKSSKKGARIFMH